MERIGLRHDEHARLAGAVQPVRKRRRWRGRVGIAGQPVFKAEVDPGEDAALTAHRAEQTGLSASPAAPAGDAVLTV